MILIASFSCILTILINGVYQCMIVVIGLMEIYTLYLLAVSFRAIIGSITLRTKCSGLDYICIQIYMVSRLISGLENSFR